MNTVNRRRHERFAVLPTYTSIVVRPQNADGECRGHIYDVSEGGIRFELDRPLAPGTSVSVEVVLPGEDRAGAGRGVLAQGTIVWVDQDEDEPGPTRMAAAITRFLRAGDRERLMRQLSSGRYARAA